MSKQKHINDREFRQIKEALKTEMSIKKVEKLFDRSNPTIVLIKKCDTFEEYKNHNKKSGGWIKIPQKKMTNGLVKASEPISPQKDHWSIFDQAVKQFEAEILTFVEKEVTRQVEETQKQNTLLKKENSALKEVVERAKESSVVSVLRRKWSGQL